ncbi:MAG: tRNA (adenosine(37)-N6)-threonylcarbamoyltransferase complex ATPase subunit type 1 TsaE [Proteobacteria bacterium]|nr:tRNA (adenosine(37)-N6)-threonylcarbamoyltransferase complex ATPase subunit type 1 TsaE [Pseudomonadota bacterium]
MSACWVFRDAGLDAVFRLASYLALVLKPGDAIALNGELGAGKTTFARGVISALLEDPNREIPSPTFALMQTYEEGRLPLAHIDCYRIEGGQELREIGLGNALGEGAVLIEWAERVDDLLPRDRLDIAFCDGAHEDTRTLTLAGQGEWRERLARLRAMYEFCAASPWAGARPVFLQGDASTRSYARLHLDGETVILMDAPAQRDGPPIRDGKSYSQLVHLAEDVKPFVAVARALKQAGVNVPGILAHDLANGFLIIEDLGNRVFADEAGDSPALEELYEAATDVLVALQARRPAGKLPLPDGGVHSLARFDARALKIEAELLLDWFYPAVRGREADAETREKFDYAFGALFEMLDKQGSAWVLRDYHSPNLLWLPEREGVARVGVIDFQDAVAGHAAYDLVSLLQDARRDIPAALEGRLYARYCDAWKARDSGFDGQAFSTCYATLGAQRNCKILGIFARLAKRDGKPGYLAHIPRVSAYLERDLAHPALERLRAWFAAHLPADMRAKPLDI